MAILGESGLRTDTITPGADFTMIITRFAGTQALTITGSPTGGTWKATYKGQQTAAVAYNASTSVLQAALEALSTIKTGNVAVSGSAGAWVVTPQGALKVTDFLLNLITLDSTGLTGGTSPKVTATMPVLDVHTGYTYELQARKLAGSSYPDILVNTAGDPNPGPAGAQGTIDVTTDGAAGQIAVHLTAAATAALVFDNSAQPHSAHWVLMETHSGVKIALVEDALFTLKDKYFV